MREMYMDVLPPVDHIAARSNWFPAAAPLWTAEENKRFESALAGLDLGRPDWEKVARAIPGRTVREVVSHFNNLQLQVNVQEIKSGLVPLPVDGGGASSFTLQWDGNGGYGPGDFRHGYRFGVGCGKRHHGRTPEQERKKGVPWTEEEHK